ncbi:unnamed protein product [Lactuca saligna]|uniref:Uncharacterized protein n=1 Tax=Lactuca saligna TaxID=75948 RepID=A0AA35ZBE9_LACSI|nr:unnamed protein product [Lactuca saligna]
MQIKPKGNQSSSNSIIPTLMTSPYADIIISLQEYEVTAPTPIPTTPVVATRLTMLTTCGRHNFANFDQISLTRISVPTIFRYYKSGGNDQIIRAPAVHRLFLHLHSSSTTSSLPHQRLHPPSSFSSSPPRHQPPSEDHH